MYTGKQRARILVIEDNPLDVRLVSEALTKSSVTDELTVLADGEEAIEYLRVAILAPDLVILDLNLPRHDGLEVLAQCRANVALRSVPIVMLTSSDSPADRRRATMGGADAFLRKPLLLAEFLALGEEFKVFLQPPPSGI